MQPADSSPAAHQWQACSYGSWYPDYASLAPRSSIISLDAACIAFLQEDGLVLHAESAALPQRAQPSDIIVEGVDYDPNDLYSDSSSAGSDDDDAGSSSSSSSSGDDSHSSRQQPWPQRFPALHASIAAAIQALGGAVAPRLNWSSPTDALWLSSSNSLRCTNPDEVVLLLKGSDRVAHDLEQLAQLCNTSQQQLQQEQPAPSSAEAHQQHASHQANPPVASSSSSSRLPAELVLRAWAPSLAPEWQFRAFVSGHAVVAISQRDPSQHFPQLAAAAAACCQEGGDEDEDQEQQQQAHSLSSIEARLVDFNRSRIGSSFPLSDYAVDVYVPPRGRLLLLDFSPICHTTSPLCFDWQELPYDHMKQQQQQLQQQVQQPSSSQGGCNGTTAQPQQQPEQLEEPLSQQQQQPQPPVPSSSSLSRVLFRVVGHEGMIAPGSRVATGMPFDMLGLPDALSSVMASMQQQQQQLQ